MTTRKPRRDVIRATPVFRSLVVLALAIGLVGLIFAPPIVPDNRRTFTFLGFLVYSIVCALGVVEVFRGRIELRDDEIRVVRILGHRDYARGRIVDVRWAKGSPVVISSAMAAGPSFQTPAIRTRKSRERFAPG